MVDFFIWFLMIGGTFYGPRFIYSGIRKNRQNKIPLKYSDFFKDISFSQSSGTQLIIEGIILSLSTLFIIYLYFT